MMFTKENAKHPLFFKTFKIENENLKLQKEMKMFWWLENNAYLCKKLVKTRKIVLLHDWQGKNRVDHPREAPQQHPIL